MDDRIGSQSVEDKSNKAIKREQIKQTVYKYSKEASIRCIIVKDKSQRSLKWDFSTRVQQTIAWLLATLFKIVFINQLDY